GMSLTASGWRAAGCRPPANLRPGTNPSPNLAKSQPLRTNTGETGGANVEAAHSTEADRRRCSHGSRNLRRRVASLVPSRIDVGRWSRQTSRVRAQRGYGQG